jgi:hypothetical protein
MSEENIFYPNKLTVSEVEDLSGWKLKVAAVHFGINRGDCVRFGYGYSKKKLRFTDNEVVCLVADSDGMMSEPISLEDEIDWNDSAQLLSEVGVTVGDLLKRHIHECVCEE